MPGYGDLMIFGISIQLRQTQKDFDEVLAARDEDFAESGLLADSLMRLGFPALCRARIY